MGSLAIASGRKKAGNYQREKRKSSEKIYDHTGHRTDHRFDLRYRRLIDCRRDHLEDLGIQAYETDWYDHIDVIKKSDMIIIAEQENQIQLINSLFMVSSELRVVVCAAFRGDEANKKLLLQNRAGTIPAQENSAGMGKHGYFQEICIPESSGSPSGI